MTAKLIVTIDTEEEGLWSGKFSGYDNPVENLAGIPAFQAICDRHGIHPTYLVNSPVVSSKQDSAVLDDILRDGRLRDRLSYPPLEHPARGRRYRERTFLPVQSAGRAATREACHRHRAD